jgi:hypothetical protein
VRNAGGRGWKAGWPCTVSLACAPPGGCAAAPRCKPSPAASPAMLCAQYGICAGSSRTATGGSTTHHAGRLPHTPQVLADLPDKIRKRIPIEVDPAHRWAPGRVRALTLSTPRRACERRRCSCCRDGPKPTLVHGWRRRECAGDVLESTLCAAAPCSFPLSPSAAPAPRPVGRLQRGPAAGGAGHAAGGGG